MIKSLGTTAPVPPRAPLPPLLLTRLTSPVSALTKKNTHIPSNFAKRSIIDHSESKRAGKTSKSRRSRVVFDFTEQELAKFFHMPQREAAKHLGVAVITVKRNCKRLGIKWPYRDAKLKQVRDAKVVTPLHEMQQPHRLPSLDSIMLLSEAARTYSRLPLGCMEENSEVAL
ncbi:Winged helix-turn-helix dna-binding domain, partial [Globisporangium splendens]